MSQAQFDSPYFAAIDLGSNSFHMLIVRISDNKVETVDREKQMVQIARGMASDGQISAEAQERALACLSQFAERIRDIPKSQIRAVGTKTLRAASNAVSFLKAAERVLGVRIQTISGFEEARLVYSGLSHTITKSNKRLVIDIGGGSTEFIIGTGHTPLMMESLALGCVSFSEDFILHSGGINSANMHKAYLAACAELEEIRKNYLKEGWEIAYGTSGTMKAVADLLADQDGGAVITKHSLNALTDATIQAGKITSTAVPKLRRDVLPAGLAILRAIFDLLNLEKIHIADGTLKEGLIYDTLGRFQDHDARFNTVAELVERYGIDRDQGLRVKNLALKFWSTIQGPELQGVSRTKVLGWAAELHEIGLSISHSGYHHHGYYILRHSDLAGFGRYEQYILANLIRLHRKKLSPAKIEGLDTNASQAMLPLLLCLRIATLLCRRRENVDQVPELQMRDGHYLLSFAPRWLEEHPLTTAGLEQECGYFNNIGLQLKLVGASA